MVLMVLATIFTTVVCLGACSKDDPIPEDPLEDACCVSIAGDERLSCFRSDSILIEVDGEWVWQHRTVCIAEGCKYYTEATDSDGNPISHSGDGCICNSDVKSVYVAVPK